MGGSPRAFRNEPPSPVADKFLAPLNFRRYRRPPDTKTATMSENLSLRGTLEGHNGWVTQIATNPKYPDMILSSSRDKSLIVWKLTRDEVQYGYPQKRLTGHGHFVSDVVLSSDGHFALSVAFSADNRQIVSGSRDKTIKLWNTLAQCKYT